MIVKNIDISTSFDGKCKLTVELTNKNDLNALQELRGIDLLNLTIKKFRKSKTKTQNAYLWTLCDKIAEKLLTDKKQIYLLAIRHVGVFELLPLKNEAVDKFISAWESRGIGWICEEFRESKLKGYTTLQCYYGSSVYDTKQQARLIEYIVDAAKELGIETMSINQIKELKR